MKCIICRGCGWYHDTELKKPVKCSLCEGSGDSALPGHDEGTVSTIKHISRVQFLLRNAADALIKRGKEHDISKLLPPERAEFSRITPLLKGMTFGSEEYNKVRDELGEVLDHHYENNRHHPEHFEKGVLGMNLIDIIEMFCDWFAASERHDDGDINRSIKVCGEKYNMSADLMSILRNTVNVIESFDKEKSNE